MDVEVGKFTVISILPSFESQVSACLLQQFNVVHQAAFS